MVYLEIGRRTGKIGTILIELFVDVVPKTARNFIGLLDKYVGSKFHRIIPKFMIQGGDITRGDGSGGYSIYGQTFEDENFKINHDEEGLLSMANSGPGTNGSQFFITLAYIPHLDGSHVVFGRVANNAGMRVVREIEKMGTEEGTPKEEIRIIGSGRLN